MARPIVERTEKSFAHDIAAFRRLRTAVVMDRRFSIEASRSAIQAIDEAIRALVRLAISIRE